MSTGDPIAESTQCGPDGPQSPEDIEREIFIARQILANEPLEDGDRAVILKHLSGFFVQRYAMNGDLADLDAAVSTAGEAVRTAPEDHPYRVACLDTFRAVLLERCSFLDNPNQSIVLLTSALEATRSHDSLRGEILNDLGMSLRDKYQQTSDSGDLDAAITTLRDAISEAPNNARFLCNVGSLLGERHERTGSVEDLHEAIFFTQRALQATPPDNDDRHQILNNLATKLVRRYRLTSSKDDLESAIAMLSEATAMSAQDADNQPNLLSNLQVALSESYQHTGRIEDLDEAVSNARQAFQSGECSNLLGRCANLATMLTDRYERTGELCDLDEAIFYGNKAVEAAIHGQPDRAAFLNSLAGSLFLRFQRTGNIDDLESAITRSEEALDSSHACHEYTVHAALLSNVAAMLSSRYQWTGDMEDLVRSISKIREAIDVVPEHYFDRPGMLNNLGNRLGERFRRIGDREDLDEAVSRIQMAVATAIHGPSKASYLTSLANKLAARHHLARNRSDLERAVSMGEEALQILPPDHPVRASLLNNLGNHLEQLYDESSFTAHLDKAIDSAKEAVDSLPPEHPDRTRMLNNLGNRLLHRHRETGDDGDEDAALQCFLEASKITTSIPLRRVYSFREAIRILYKQRNWAEASRCATAAVELLPHICSRHLSLTDQQYALEQTSGLAADACAIALQLGDVGSALQQVEYGRGILLGNLVDSRSDLSELRRHHPALAGEYETARFHAFRNIEEQNDAIRELMWKERKEAARRLRDCEARIRKEKDFENFLKPLALADLVNCGQEGPVVVVNVTDIGSDAIIISPSGISQLPLPKMSSRAPSSIREKLGRYRSLSETDEGRNVRVKRKADVEIFPWLWETCVEPILDHLGYLSPNKRNAQIPRVWWIGTGVAAGFPFHAAGLSNIDSPTNCMDHVISSYTPTIKALNHARERDHQMVKFEHGKDPLLVVSMPTTPAPYDPLPGVVRERETIQNVAEGVFEVNSLECPTAEQVLGGLGTVGIVHFACHAHADAADPSGSHLVLQKPSAAGPKLDQLTVSSIWNVVSQSHAWIAYLSACSSAETTAERLSDESIHLASAFQVAGFSHVIGSLKPADDEACVEVARSFYESLCRYDGTHVQSGFVAEAVHIAVLEVRRRNSRSPHLWAPFIHLGA